VAFGRACVDSLSTIHEVSIWPSVECVSASSTVHTISPCARFDHVVASTSPHAICLITRRDLIVSAPAEDQCPTGRVDDDVASSAAEKGVDSRASAEHVVATET